MDGGREQDFRTRGMRFFTLPNDNVSVATLQREFEIAKDRFPVVYGDEQFAKPGTLPDPEALQWAFEMVRTRNPNLVEPTMFLGAWEIEREAISMLAQMFNHPAYNKVGFNPEQDPVLGWFTDGGTTSVLQASWALRNRHYRARQAERDSNFNASLHSGTLREEGLLGLVREGYIDPNNPPVVLAPVDLHFAGDKAVDILGLGLNNIIRYDLNADFTTNYASLEKTVQNLLSNGREILFTFASAGSTDTGRVEDVGELSSTLLKSDLNAPIIVDAAQQFMMLALLGERYPAWDFRVHGVEAIISDPHKTDASTYPGGTVIFRDKRIAQDTTFQAGYLHSDGGDFDMKETWNLYPSLHTSRSPIGAISTWVHFLRNGRKSLTEKYGGLHNLTAQIADYVRESEHYDLVLEPQTGIVAFHVNGLDDEKAQQVSQLFDQSRDKPRISICYADNVRLRTALDHREYVKRKMSSGGKRITAGYGGLYIQVMQHTTSNLVAKLTERLDRFGKEVMGR